jgi:chemotaxis protein histidine kinase CheA
MNQYPSDIDRAEAELQQELREMFTVDTQQHLETYFSLIQQLNPQSWDADIQHLYRAIHTVKGGAVTVAADAMLHAAMVLEDLLSDLRYLESAPMLADGELGQILLEAGELLSSSVEITETGAQAIDQVQPTVRRLEQLRDRVKQLYLPEWNELKQVHQEFAEQGFDLVILDLEIALSKMPDRGLVSAETIEKAQATIAQLTQIGIDLELAEDWTILLHDCEQLITKPDCQLWASVWFEYFEILKICAKNSGEFTKIEIDRLDTLTVLIQSCEIDLLGSDSVNANIDLSGSLDDFFLAEEIELLPAIESNLELSEFSGEFSGELSGTLADFFLAEEIELLPATESNLAPSEFSGELSGTLADFLLDEEVELDYSEPLSSSVEQSDLLLSRLPLQQEEHFATGAVLPPQSIENTDDLPDLLDNFFDDFSLENIPDLEDRSALMAIDLLRSAEELPLPVNTTEEIFPIQAEAISLQSPDLLVGKIEELEYFIKLDADELITEEIQEEDFINPGESNDAGELRSTESATILSSEILPTIVTKTPTPATPVTSVKRSIQIPVPLERLDKSAYQVVDTLLTARAVMNISSQLQSQLARLTSLTRENSQFVTRLRQLQDDYALLRNLSDEQQDTTNNVTLERYRQGYSTIVRLLENILRLSELGQEIETSTYQNSIRLDALDRSILQLKDGIETSRLVPFRNLTLRSKAILRDLTNRYGKPAELTIENEQIELDAGIVQQLEPALLHLLRNAYDHGLESIEQRLDTGKAPKGKIHIALQQQGNLYRLTIEDDGGGIDADLIHQMAKSKGFALDRTSTNAELLAVLCQPGFSSNSTVTEVSGRGVGMDVVVSQIASIGGKLSLETHPGRGTKFSIEVPAPQLLLPCVLFQVGDRVIALPTDNVLETALLSSMTKIESSEKTAGMCTWLLTNPRGEISGFDLNDYWQAGNFTSGNSSQRSFPDTAVCIRTQQAEDTPEIWSIADDLLGQVKLLINPLPSPLIAPTGLLGVSLQPDGKLISILDPIALSAMITSTATQSATADVDELAIPADSTEAARSSTPTILIVDDAVMIRRRLEASLNTYGFTTHTCNDGLEALNWLQNNHQPDLIITDVEMPNMDGFTLIARARQAQIDIPILVVSSRSSEEWGKEARRLGATDYLNKGFATSELLQKVNSLLGLLVDA